MCLLRFTRHHLYICVFWLPSSLNLSLKFLQRNNFQFIYILCRCQKNTLGINVEVKDAKKSFGLDVEMNKNKMFQYGT